MRGQKVLSFLLSAAMTLSLVPAPALAEAIDDGNLLAQAQTTYNVTFDLNGGELENFSSAQQVTEGGYATEPTGTPVKEGYNFLYWADANGQFNWNTPINSDTQLTATYEINQYRVIFEKETTSGQNQQVGNAVDVDYGEAINNFPQGTDNFPTEEQLAAPDNYVYNGWYVKGTNARWNTDDAMTEATTNVENTGNVATPTITLVADLAEDSIELTFDADGGELTFADGLSNPLVVQRNSAVPAKTDGKPTVEATKEGYDFVRWYYIGSDGQKRNWSFDTTDMVTRKSRTVIAEWTPKTYTVAFSATDATSGGTIDPQTVEHGKKATEPTAPSKGNAKFLGWYDGDTKFDFSTPITKDTTLVAKFETEAYNLTISRSGLAEYETTHEIQPGVSITESRVGTISRDKWSVEGEEYGPRPVKLGEKAVEPKVQETLSNHYYGYEYASFVKWVVVNEQGYAIDAKGNRLTTNLDDAIEFDFENDELTKDTYVAPVYELNTWTITFDLGEGTPAEDANYDDFEYSDMTLNSTPVRRMPKDPVAPEGKNFIGWYYVDDTTDADGAKFNFPADTSFDHLFGDDYCEYLGKDYDLEARYALTNYTIKFNPNVPTDAPEGAVLINGDKMALQPMSQGVEDQLSENQFAIQNASGNALYKFMGWSTTADGEVVYEDGATVKDLAKSGNFQLYAQWAPCYTVTLDANGGTGNTDPIECVLADAAKGVELPANTFTLDGYEFVEWNTVKTPNSADQGTAYADGATFIAKEPKQGDNITLYAQWQATKTAITFDANGGEGTMDAITVDNSKVTMLPVSKFTRENFVQSYGWYDNSDDSFTVCSWATVPSVADAMQAGLVPGVDFLVFDNPQSVCAAFKDAEVTLYAQWSDDMHELTLYPGEGLEEYDYITFFKHDDEASKLPSIATILDRFEDEDEALSAWKPAGKKLVGWNTKANGKGTAYDDLASIADLEEDVTLYAQWSDEAPVAKFVVEGKTIFEGAAIGTTVDSESYGKYAYPVSKVGEEPTKAPVGDKMYEFVGWEYNGVVVDDYLHYEENVSIDKQLYDCVAYLDDFDPINADVTFTAKFVEADYIERVEVPASVSFVYDGTEKTPYVNTKQYSVSGDVTKTDVDGVYNVTLTLNNSVYYGEFYGGKYYVWADDQPGTTRTVTWEITPKPIDKPTAATKLTYNKKAQTGVAEGEGYTIKGNTSTKAGSYTATATLVSGNYKWSDGDKAASTDVKWSIAKAKQTVTAKKKTVTADGKASKKTKKTTKKVTVAAKNVTKGNKAVNEKSKAKLTYKLVKANKSKKFFKVAKDGKITVKKGLKKGTYKLTLKATSKATTNYKSASKKFVVTVKVK